MCKIKFILITVLLCSFSNILFAQQVTINEAKQAASVAMYMFGKDKSMNSIEKSISIINNVTEEGNVLMYELVFNDGSSMLVSGNKNCEPILAYNETFKKSLFDENLGCCLKAYIDDFKYNINSCFLGVLKNDSNVMEWNNMLKAYASSKGGNNGHIEVNDVNVIVAPLLTSRWGQDASNNSALHKYYLGGDKTEGECSAYNYYVTETGNKCECNNKKCPTGCVATATAQILYYWKYAKNKNFDWCNMVDSLYTCTQTNHRDVLVRENGITTCHHIWDTVPNIHYEQQRNSVAYLMRQVGLDLGMKYCKGGDCESGVSTTNVDNVFRDYGYSNAYRRLIGIYKVLKKKMWKNLDSGYPIQFSTGSHSFVCDGYGYQISNGDHLFHFNWGHTDSQAEFEKLWMTISNVSCAHDAILDIYPDDAETYGCKLGMNRDISLTHKILPFAVARNSITLKPGFMSGNNFHAYIKPCKSCDNKSNHAPSNQVPPRYDNQIDESETDPAAITANSQISIFPNPTTGIVNISVLGEAEIKSISMLDISGRVLKNNAAFAGNTLDLSDLSNGIYLVQIRTSAEQTTHKVTIKK